MFGRKLIPALLAGAFLVVLCKTSRAGDECASYYEKRVGYLLGCCGDVPVGYPGPPFPGKLDDGRRATLAIEEARHALEICAIKDSPEYLSLTLDMAGAYLMRAHAKIEAAGADARHSTMATASGDAASALQILLTFEKVHPSESGQSWKWMATALSQAGSPWEGLVFLAQLPSDYMQEGDVRRIEGDLLFELGMRSPAAKAYTNWLSAPNVDLCALDSFANTVTLQRSGFTLPQYSRSEEVICLTGSFQYYIFLHAGRTAR